MPRWSRWTACSERTDWTRWWYVDEDELTERLLARGRADDTEETIRNRFKIYMDQTQPLIDEYESRSLTVTVDGIGGVEEVTERILDKLDDPATKS